MSAAIAAGIEVKASPKASANSPVSRLAPPPRPPPRKASPERISQTGKTANATTMADEVWRQVPSVLPKMPNMNPVDITRGSP